MLEIGKVVDDFLNHERTKNALIYHINQSDILKHYSKRTWNLDMTKLIRKFILEVLLKLKWNTNFKEDTIKTWSNLIKEKKDKWLYDDFIYSFIDTNFDDIQDYNYCFQKYIYIEKWDKPEDMFKILQKAQYYWYRTYLDTFTYLFTQFIENEFLWKNNMYSRPVNKPYLANLINMKRENLLWEFLEDKVLISRIKKDYKKIIDYYDKNHWYWFNGAKIIFDFIESNYYQLTYEDWLNYRRLEEWINEIKEYEPNDYIFELADVDDEIILDSYSVFRKYVNASDDDFDNLAILRDAQYMWFEDLFWRINKEFIGFLEEKVKNRGRRIR